MIHEIIPANQKIREMCLSSIFWTARYLCGWSLVSPIFHKAACDWVQKQIEAGEQYICLLAPREHYKTSAVGQALVVWLLINNANTELMYTMHTHSFAEEKMNVVKGVFQNDVMKACFPELHVGGSLRNKGQIWAADAFTVPRDNMAGTPSVKCMGIVSGKEGWHGRAQVWDDPIDADYGDSATQIKASIAKLKRIPFLFKSDPDPKNKSFFLLLGTLHEGGFYEKVLRLRHFRCMVIGCYIDNRFFNLLKESGVSLPDESYTRAFVHKENQDIAWQHGSPIFPELRTMRELKAMESASEDDFSSQMLNIPASLLKRQFDRRDARFYEFNDTKTACIIDAEPFPISTMRIILTIDPTGGMSRGCDFAAIVIVGWVRSHKLAFVLDYWQGRSDPLEQILRSLQMAVKWNIDYYVPESVGYQQTYEFWFKQKKRELAKYNKANFQVIPYKKGGHGTLSKSALIKKSIQPYWRSHSIILHETDHKEILEEMVGLNIRTDGKIMGDSPAIADCLAMQPRYWTTNYSVAKDEGVDRPLIRDEEDEEELQSLYGLGGCET